MKGLNLERVIDDVLKGKPVIIADDSTRENECDLVVAAKFVTPEIVKFFTQYTSGLMCVAIDHNRMKHLGISSLVKEAQEDTTFYAMPVDAANGISTGISSSDRAHTIRTLADPKTEKKDVRAPGHISIVHAHRDGLSGRRGHTEASIRLMELAGIDPSVSLISEIVDRDLNPVASVRAKNIAESLSLSFTSVSEIIDAQTVSEKKIDIQCSATSYLDTLYGRYKIYIFKSCFNDQEYPVLIYTGDREAENATFSDEYIATKPVNIRVHSGCFTGNVFFSQMCDCYEQLCNSMSYIEKQGNGMVIYLPDHEGRGIGLINKIRAYAIQQNRKLDTVEANLALSLPIDKRDYSIAASIIKHFNIQSIRLISNNPIKRDQLKQMGIKIEELVHIKSKKTKYNMEYLDTKKKKMGHHSIY